jgi:DNA helicase II / ATP-dependent DNA helicase PcrA
MAWYVLWSKKMSNNEVSQEELLKNLSSDEKKIIEEENILHTKVKYAVRDLALKGKTSLEGVNEELIELRDEAAHASERDLPLLFQQLAISHSLASRDVEQKLPDMRSPYFGRMILKEEDKVKEILIGNATFLDSENGISIVDWRHAQIAKLFFNFREGDDYDIELPGRFAEGVMESRKVLSFDVGELVGVTSPGINLFRERGGEWHSSSGEHTGFDIDKESKEERERFGSGLTSRRNPEISALLDKQQYELMTRSDKQPLLVLGGAGCGKTTVAMHRMSQLAYKKPNFYKQSSMMVVVPEQGLVRLSQRLLKNLDLGKVNVNTFDGWVKSQAKKVFKGLPKRYCEETPASVIILKRHPAMLKLIDKLAIEVGNEIATRMKRSLHNIDHLADEFASERNLPLLPRLFTWKDKCLEAGTRPAATRGFFDREIGEVANAAVMRSELFSNKDLLATLEEESNGDITPQMIEALVKHNISQYDEEANTSGIQAVDGGALDKDDFAGTIDIEDIPVLLCALKKFVGNIGSYGKAITKYTHLVVDEAQDLGPMELMILGESMHSNSSITIAGDAAQQSDPTIKFEGWDGLMRRLGVEEVEANMLQTNYRCPKPIADYGQVVLGPLAPEIPPNTTRGGRPVLTNVYPNDGVAFVSISEALTELRTNERLASIAVICSDTESALKYYKGLRHSIDDVRYVPDGEFSFMPGIDVTDVAQIKGLEFDYVIIPDANIREYPNNNVSCRALHVAVTRAVHQLWVVSVGTKSDLLP